MKRYAYAYDKARNRTGALYNSVNQLTNMQSAGLTRFAGWISETGLVTVAGVPGTMSTCLEFVRRIFKNENCCEYC